ncbi:co-chaperone GroES [Methylococcus sp. EFPC2]|uniref:co-chaperone GroES n=1 Tax=Methylococcus sp. EFPC2 TaxID=2812648 RepID=UPI001966EB04|nr:co-chaperone GroES [Methylococcus sp. EFPC2]QSA98673.1 co-chaperone GroES [Methylococcus sp. EFPC2]
MTQTVRPLYDRLLVKRSEDEQTTPGGIVIPDAAKEKPIKGEIIAAGLGKPLDNGSLRPLSVKVGDKVLFGKYAGTEVKIDGNEYLVLREEDVIAVLEG